MSFFNILFPIPRAAPQARPSPYQNRVAKKGGLRGASAFADFEMLPLRVLMFPNTKKFKITPFYAKMIK